LGSLYTQFFTVEQAGGAYPATYEGGVAHQSCPLFSHSTLPEKPQPEMPTDMLQQEVFYVMTPLLYVWTADVKQMHAAIADCLANMASRFGFAEAGKKERYPA